MPCVNAVSFREMPSAAEVCRFVRAAGFDGLELSRPLFYEAFPGPNGARRLRELAHEHALNFLGFDCWVDVDPYENRQGTLDDFAKSIDWASRLELQMIISHDPWASVNADRSPSECMTATIELFRPVLEACLHAGLRLVFEPHPDTLSMDNQWAIDFVDRLGDGLPPGSVGILYDCCHYGVGQPDEYVKSINTLGSRVEHVHFSDGDRKTYARHLPIGDGSLDLCAVVDALKKIRFHGTLTNDLYNCPNLEKSASYNATRIACIEHELGLAHVTLGDSRERRR